MPGRAFPRRARRGTDQRTGQNLSGFTAYLAAERAARPFVVDSLLPTGSGGDLQVEVNEADGQINRFIVPFSAVPNMLKEGLFKYELNAGEVRLTDTAYHPDFAQLNLQYGINNTLTGYGGVIAAENYQAFLLGSGFNLPIGALSVDITHSDARFGQDMPRYRGESYKVAYSRFIHQTNTNFHWRLTVIPPAVISA